MPPTDSSVPSPHERDAAPAPDALDGQIDRTLRTRLAPPAPKSLPFAQIRVGLPSGTVTPAASVSASAAAGPASISSASASISSPSTDAHRASDACCPAAHANGIPAHAKGVPAQDARPALTSNARTGDAVTTELRPRGSIGPAASRRRVTRRTVRVAASVLFTCATIAIIVVQNRPGPVPNVPPVEESRPITTVYHERINLGFRPDWECRDDVEFAETFAYRYGQPLQLATLPADAVCLGLAYGTALSPNSTFLLGQVGNDRVLVVIDHAVLDREAATRVGRTDAHGDRNAYPNADPHADPHADPQSDNPATDNPKRAKSGEGTPRVPRDGVTSTTTADGLHLFRRELRGIVMYEATPRTDPVFLPRLLEAPVPEGGAFDRLRRERNPDGRTSAAREPASSAISVPSRP